MNRDEPYQGFEQGPIRPPSESRSLLIRVTRNCPWNRCTFCGLYKGERFSRRPVAHVLQDIDTISRYVRALAAGNEHNDDLSAGRLPSQVAVRPGEEAASHAAYNWLQSGARSVFLQDSNSLILKPDDLERILVHLRQSFPTIQRITSYARSQTIASMHDHDLARLAAAGLNRIHIGLESGCDSVLAQVKKGADKQTHIIAGQKVKRAAIQLSEYFMPGLGGRQRSREHALESADALCQINPEYIRIRTLALPETLELSRDVQTGAFKPMNDLEIAEELLLFLESLEGIISTVRSDHILNLLEEVNGVLPRDKERMLAVVRRFLAMDTEEQILYRVGRRCGLFRRLDDCRDPVLRRQAQQYIDQFAVTPATIDQFTDAMMNRFI